MTAMVRARRLKLLVLLGPSLAFLTLFFVLPLVLIFVVSFYGVDKYGNTVEVFTFLQYVTAFTDPLFAGTFLATAIMSVQVTALCLLLGYPAAYAMATTRSARLRLLMYIVVVSPLLTSVIVRTFGWQVLLASAGPINKSLLALGLISEPLQMLGSNGAVIVAITHVLLPFMILPLATAIGDVDPALKKASASLGAGRFTTFFRVTLPLTLPGISSGVMLVFVLAMGIYITPLLVANSMLPLTAIRVYDTVLQLFNFPLGAALSFALLGTTVILSWGLNFVLKRWERKIHG